MEIVKIPRRPWKNELWQEKRGVYKQRCQQATIALRREQRAQAILDRRFLERKEERRDVDLWNEVVHLVQQSELKEEPQTSSSWEHHLQHLTCVSEYFQVLEGLLKTHTCALDTQCLSSPVNYRLLSMACGAIQKGLALWLQTKCANKPLHESLIAIWRWLRAQHELITHTHISKHNSKALLFATFRKLLTTWSFYTSETSLEHVSKPLLKEWFCEFLQEWKQGISLWVDMDVVSSSSSTRRSSMHQLLTMMDVLSPEQWNTKPASTNSPVTQSQYVLSMVCFAEVLFGDKYFLESMLETTHFFQDVSSRCWNILRQTDCIVVPHSTPYETALPSSVVLFPATLKLWTLFVKQCLRYKKHTLWSDLPNATRRQWVQCWMALWKKWGLARHYCLEPTLFPVTCSEYIYKLFEQMESSILHGLCLFLHDQDECVNDDDDEEEVVEHKHQQTNGQLLCDELQDWCWKSLFWYVRNRDERKWSFHISTRYSIRILELLLSSRCNWFQSLSIKDLMQSLCLSISRIQIPVRPASMTESEFHTRWLKPFLHFLSALFRLMSTFLTLFQNVSFLDEMYRVANNTSTEPNSSSAAYNAFRRLSTLTAIELFYGISFWLHFDDTYQIVSPNKHDVCSDLAERVKNEALLVLCSWWNILPREEIENCSPLLLEIFQRCWRFWIKHCLPNHDLPKWTMEHPSLANLWLQSMFRIAQIQSNYWNLSQHKSYEDGLLKKSVQTWIQYFPMYQLPKLFQ